MRMEPLAIACDLSYKACGARTRSSERPRESSVSDAWGKAYAFNATLQNVEGFFNDPQSNRFTVFRCRASNPPYMAQAVSIDRGERAPGVFSDQTSATFQDQGGSWGATYEIVVPTAGAAAVPIPISREDDLVLYIYRTFLALFDTHGFNLSFISASSSWGPQ
jgi:hypothetical protein